MRKAALVGVLLMLLGMEGASPAQGTSAFTFNWNGVASTPQEWVPQAVNDWDVVVHSRDNHLGLNTFQGAHGADCGAYPATHTISTFDGAVYICRNHLMTAVDALGYGEIVLTPAQMVDFSQGATVQISTTSLRTNDRDFISFQLTPFGENLVYPLDYGFPDGQGEPKDGLEISTGEGIPTYFNVDVYRGFQDTELQPFYIGGNSVEECVGSAGVSATRRDVYQMQLTSTHLRLVMLVNGVPCTLFDHDVPNLGFSQGVFQIAHHNYTPFKAMSDNCTAAVPCTLGTPNTWHWSDFSITNPVPFTMLRGDQALTGASPVAPTVNFAEPAPAGSYLRFAGFAQRHSVQVSLNGGPFQAATEQAESGSKGDGSVDDYHDLNYWMAVPAGTKSVTFKAQSNWSGQPWAMQGVAIWSQTQTAGGPPAQTPPPANAVGPAPPPPANPCPPLPPSLGSVTTIADGNGQVTVRWAPPLGLPGCPATVDGYAVYAYPQTPATGVVLTNNTSAVYRGLAPGQPYTFTVDFHSPGQWAAWSTYTPYMPAT